MEKSYEAPAIVDLGSFAEKTLSTITKQAGGGDVIVINGQVVATTPGHDPISIS